MAGGARPAALQTQARSQPRLDTRALAAEECGVQAEGKPGAQAGIGAGLEVQIEAARRSTERAGPGDGASETEVESRPNVYWKYGPTTSAGLR